MNLWIVEYFTLHGLDDELLSTIDTAWDSVEKADARMEELKKIAPDHFAITRTRLKLNVKPEQKYQ